MSIFIIILVYISTVLASRYLNKKLYQRDRFTPIWWFLWFIPVINIPLFVILTLIDILGDISWFSGKNW